MKQNQRGVSEVISVILLVAIVVILAATVSVFALGFSEEVDNSAPNVAETTGEFVPGAASDEQIVRVTHVAGDSVAVENIEIIVRASGPGVDAEARLINLPTDSFFSNAIDASNVQGDDIIGTSNRPPNQVIIPADPNTWTAGRTIQFRVKTGGADFRDGASPDADRLKITVVHTPSDSILFTGIFVP